MSGTRSDEDLMLEYAAGDARAFEVLYGRHKGPLYRYLLRQCRLAAVAEELFQDVWMNLIRARARYEPRAKFATYLFSLAHNRLIDHYRQQGRGVPVSYDDDPDDSLLDRQPAAAQTQPDQQADLARRAGTLLRLIEGLPEAQREALLLREEAGLSLEEIAAATGVNMETAKSRLRYAVTKLRHGMQAAGMDET
jgi:RNA polymerase sigma-70 factor (ECF subfamily)